MKTFSANQILAILLICCVGIAVAIVAFILMRSREAQRLAQIKEKYELLDPKVLCIERLVSVGSFLRGKATASAVVHTNMNTFLSQVYLQEYLAKGLAGNMPPGYEAIKSSGTDPGESSLANVLEKDKLNRYCAIIDSLVKRVMQNIYLIAPAMYQIVLGPSLHDSSVSINEQIENTSAKELIEEIVLGMEALEKSSAEKLQGVGDIMLLIDSCRKDLIEIVDNPDQIKAQLDLVSGVPGSESHGASNQGATARPLVRSA